jgi:large subunit ribosomal protein L1
MSELPKRKQSWAKLREHNKSYPMLDAFKIVKQAAVAKFDEAVDVAINLGIDAKKSDQTVRGSVVLPAGTGKKVRVAVFAEAGADIVGMDDLAESIKSGKIDFDVVIASPDTMRVVGQLGQILGPRGLMPNPKVGTVTPDVAGAVRNARAGQVQYRADKSGIVQCSIGRASFSPEQLRDNLTALVDAVNKSRPSNIKGVYLRKVSVSSTMGPGVRVDVSGMSGGAAQH